MGSIARMQMKADWSIPYHSHDFQEIVLIVEGQVETRMGDKTSHAGPGMLKVHPRGVSHTEHAVGLDNIVLLCANFQAASDSEVAGWPLLVADRTGRIRMLMEWMVELSPPHDHASALARDGLLQAVALAIASAAGGASDDLVLNIRSWVRAHITQPIYLEDLAKVAGVSRYHFNRIFSKAAGMPPMRFVREMRVDAARGLLLNTSMPLRAIAPMVGFTDEFQLSRVFRELTGQSPATLRRSTIAS
jgi:AraC-like DNA-binding protein